MSPSMLRALLMFSLFVPVLSANDDYLQWDAGRAKAIVHAHRVNGQVGKSLDFRIKATDRSYNFKLRATWMTPDVIQAMARLEQLSKALGDGETKALVRDALNAGDIVIQLELDPREGSGIIPSDWVALLGPRLDRVSEDRVVRGQSRPELRALPALAPIQPRDYSYEVFWVVFPGRRAGGKPLFDQSDQEAELSVRIQGKVGKVRWPVPRYGIEQTQPRP